jgi:WD40 repeat protein
VHSVAFSPDGRDLAAASGNYGDFDEPGAITIWNAATGRERRVLKGHRGGVTALAYSRDGERLATGGEAGTVKIWETRSGQDLLTLGGGDDFRVGSLAFSPDGSRLAASGLIGGLRIWTAAP